VGGRELSRRPGSAVRRVRGARGCRRSGARRRDPRAWSRYGNPNDHRSDTATDERSRDRTRVNYRTDEHWGAGDQRAYRARNRGNLGAVEAADEALAVLRASRPRRTECPTVRRLTGLLTSRSKRRPCGLRFTAVFREASETELLPRRRHRE